jgi:hypothetical protein
MSKERRDLTPDSVRAIVGELNDARMAAILKTGASVEELEEAAALGAGESDVVGQEGHKTSRIVAELYEILMPEPDEETERRRG